jgi:hypothetical protein
MKECKTKESQHKIATATMQRNKEKRKVAGTRMKMILLPFD